jgi:hypothetical protein
MVYYGDHLMSSVQLGQENEAVFAFFTWALGSGVSIELRKRETTVSLLYASKRALALLPILWRTHRLPVGTYGMSDLSSRIAVRPYGILVQLIASRYLCEVRHLQHALQAHALFFARLTAEMWRSEAS